jgi:hypothetical protein
VTHSLEEGCCSSDFNAVLKKTPPKGALSGKGNYRRSERRGGAPPGSKNAKPARVETDGFRECEKANVARQNDATTFSGFASGEG